jgi:fatty-acyl-CoA synthase
MRGPNISPGYWNRPAETASAFQQGWLKSGDAARCDSDGFYWLMDRRKDMFISGGENVYPAEVEAVILELAEITEAAVIGVADPRWGEVGHAYVVARPDSILTAQTVLDHCGERLARYKIPKSVMIVQTLPRTASGKVQKHILRDALLKA